MYGTDWKKRDAEFLRAMGITMFIIVVVSLTIVYFLHYNA